MKASIFAAMALLASLSVACKNSSRSANKGTPNPEQNPYQPQYNNNAPAGTAPEIVGSPTVPSQVRRGELLNMQVQVYDADNDISKVEFVPGGTSSLVRATLPFAASGSSVYSLDIRVPDNAQSERISGDIVVVDAKGNQAKRAVTFEVLETRVSSGNGNQTRDVLVNGVAKPIWTVAMQALLARGVDCRAPKDQKEQDACTKAQAAQNLGVTIMDILIR